MNLNKESKNKLDIKTMGTEKFIAICAAITVIFCISFMTTCQKNSDNKEAEIAKIAIEKGYAQSKDGIGHNIWIKDTTKCNDNK